MKSIVIYESIHHNNTEKIAKVIADEIDAELVNVRNFTDSHKNLDDYDLVGFGSGIYYGKIHKNIKKFIETTEHMDNQKTFIFTTSGRSKEEYNEKFEELLSSKGFNVIANFTCKCFDTFGPLKLVGGINKGRPNEEDLDNAKNFAKSLLE
ncbi:flavodoxin family protein [Methanobrevibacter sp. TMH8]|uniref:flavodoxin family protein n=1 Tax=Methanobrevibacter sp. TMH8 TaxID=2848611 RepID=UPI001CD02F3F|nr:flavodoxin family protein [Methanobrevibacter sp. TMH8]MBZ9570096.1 flavodoxin family protein [Methanobrevibacter sp. TMH8]